MSKKYFKILIIVGLIISLIIIFLIIHPSVLRTPPLNKGGWNTNQIEPKALSVNNVKVSLVILDKRYETEVKDGSTVFEAMKKIQDESSSTNPFSFKYKENPGLGSFITEINNVVGSPGKYWIYYVNGTKASVGVSTYVLKEGDIINWNQEGI